MEQLSSDLKARGAEENPRNRFEALDYEPERDPDHAVDPDDGPQPTTLYFRDRSRSAITYNDSPDIGFDAGLNPYRGCEHGCAYCYARPTHEYLGFSAGLDFETRIMVKEEAPKLLRAELADPKWEPQVVALSGVTDPYQPIERKLRLTRRCLAVLAEFRNPTAIVTKNALVTRDLDLLEELARFDCVTVAISVTTLEEDLRRKLEPRAPAAERRLAAVRELAEAGVPVGVLAAPMIPGLNDHELPEIVRRAAEAGASFVKYTMLRLPHGVKEIFANWLERHYPLKKKKVLNRVRSTRDGKLYDATFGERFRGKGAFADQVATLHRVACERHGLPRERPTLTTDHFQRQHGEQLELF